MILNDSVVKNEKTLPINWDTSGIMATSNLSGAGDNTLLSEKKNLDKTQPYRSMPDLSTVGLTTAQKSSSTSQRCLSRYHRSCGTPGSHQPHLTQREYDQQLDEFRRENFNLKVRIHFLIEQLSDIKDHSVQDLARKLVNLQTEMEMIKTDLSGKDQMLQDAMQVIRQTKEIHAQEIEEWKSNKEAHKTREELEDLEYKMSELILENQAFKRKMGAKGSNANLDVYPATDSDSEVSLLNSQEKLNLQLKTKLAKLEQQLADERLEFEKQLKELDEKFQTKEDEMLPQLQSTGFGAASIIELESEPLSHELQVELENKNQRVHELENKLGALTTEKSQMSHEIDDLKSTLQKEQENAVKREKIIQALSKHVNVTPESRQIRSAPVEGIKVTFKPDSNGTNQAIDWQNVSSLTDPSLMNFTRFESLSLGLEITSPENMDASAMFEQYEQLRMRIKELEHCHETFYARIGNVAESLLNLAGRLGGEAEEKLSSFSKDLSRLRDDILGSSDPSLVLNQSENEREIDRLNSDVIFLNGRLSELEDLLSQKDRIIENVSRSKGDLERRIQASEKELFVKIDEIENISKKIDQQSSAHKTDLERLKHYYEIEITELKSEIVTAKDAYFKEKQTLLQEIDRYESAIKDGENLASETINNLKLVSATLDDKDLASKVAATEQNVSTLMTPFSDILGHAKLDGAKAKPGSGYIVLSNQVRLLLLKELDKVKVVLQNVLEYVNSNEKRPHLVTEATQFSASSSDQVSSDEQERSLQLERMNRKLEKYAKQLKAKYRHLQAMHRETCERLERHAKLSQKLHFGDDLENLDHNRLQLDEAVRLLEENNRVLALQVDQHAQSDAQVKLRAAKYTVLKEKQQKAVAAKKKPQSRNPQAENLL